ncbi:hypothetical protein V1477_002614 [Vespula maculifrons]|uniref:Uncharacterized protein n=1 Tax=Vespula maculifrons TaxID=7453 RepID=A0ABD2CV34_VESMC
MSASLASLSLFLQYGKSKVLFKELEKYQLERKSNAPLFLFEVYRLTCVRSSKVVRGNGETTLASFIVQRKLGEGGEVEEEEDHDKQNKSSPEKEKHFEESSCRSGIFESARAKDSQATLRYFWNMKEKGRKGHGFYSLRDTDT